MGITGDLNAWFRRQVGLLVAPPMPTLIMTLIVGIMRSTRTCKHFFEYSCNKGQCTGLGSPILAQWRNTCTLPEASEY